MGGTRRAWVVVCAILVLSVSDTAASTAWFCSHSGPQVSHGTKTLCSACPPKGAATSRRISFCCQSSGQELCSWSQRIPDSNCDASTRPASHCTPPRFTCDGGDCAEPCMVEGTRGQAMCEGSSNDCKWVDIPASTCLGAPDASWSCFFNGRGVECDACGVLGDTGNQLDVRCTHALNTNIGYPDAACGLLEKPAAECTPEYAYYCHPPDGDVASKTWCGDDVCPPSGSRSVVCCEDSGEVCTGPRLSNSTCAHLPKPSTSCASRTWRCKVGTPPASAETCEVCSQGEERQVLCCDSTSSGPQCKQVDPSECNMKTRPAERCWEGYEYKCAREGGTRPPSPEQCQPRCEDEDYTLKVLCCPRGDGECSEGTAAPEEVCGLQQKPATRPCADERTRRQRLRWNCLDMEEMAEEPTVSMCSTCPESGNRLAVCCRYIDQENDFCGIGFMETSEVCSYLPQPPSRCGVEERAFFCAPTGPDGQPKGEAKKEACECSGIHATRQVLCCDSSRESCTSETAYPSNSMACDGLARPPEVCEQRQWYCGTNSSSTLLACDAQDDGCAWAGGATRVVKCCTINPADPSQCDGSSAQLLTDGECSKVQQPPLRCDGDTVEWWCVDQAGQRQGCDECSDDREVRCCDTSLATCQTGVDEELCLGAKPAATCDKGSVWVCEGDDGGKSPHLCSLCPLSGSRPSQCCVEDPYAASDATRWVCGDVSDCSHLARPSQRCAPHCYANGEECNGHGSCNGDQTACVCDEGYIGLGCHSKVDEVLQDHAQKESNRVELDGLTYCSGATLGVTIALLAVSMLACCSCLGLGFKSDDEPLQLTGFAATPTALIALGPFISCAAGAPVGVLVTASIIIAVVLCTCCFHAVKRDEARSDDDKSLHFYSGIFQCLPFTLAVISLVLAATTPLTCGPETYRLADECILCPTADEPIGSCSGHGSCYSPLLGAEGQVEPLYQPCDCDVGYYGFDCSSPCPAGFSCGVVAVTAAGSRPTVPVQCQPGFMCPLGVDEPQPCAAGTYNDQAGTSRCESCPIGHYCPEGATQPVPCPFGTFGDSKGLASPECSGLCDLAEPGSVTCTPYRWYCSNQDGGYGSCAQCTADGIRDVVCCPSLTDVAGTCAPHERVSDTQCSVSKPDITCDNGFGWHCAVPEHSETQPKVATTAECSPDSCKKSVKRMVGCCALQHGAGHASSCNVTDFVANARCAHSSQPYEYCDLTTWACTADIMSTAKATAENCYSCTTERRHVYCCSVSGACNADTALPEHHCDKSRRPTKHCCSQLKPNPEQPLVVEPPREGILPDISSQVLLGIPAVLMGACAAMLVYLSYRDSHPVEADYTATNEQVAHAHEDTLEARLSMVKHYSALQHDHRGDPTDARNAAQAAQGGAAGEYNGAPRHVQTYARMQVLYEWLWANLFLAPTLDPTEPTVVE